jgi:hypothetical protein
MARLPRWPMSFFRQKHMKKHQVMLATNQAPGGWMRFDSILAAPPAPQRRHTATSPRSVQMRASGTRARREQA